MTINESKLNEFLAKAVGDLGAALSATLVLVGDRLGLYKELARGAVTSAELAQRTATNERYVREWLGNQGASGYVRRCAPQRTRHALCKCAQVCRSLGYVPALEPVHK